MATKKIKNIIQNSENPIKSIDAMTDDELAELITDKFIKEVFIRTLQHNVRLEKRIQELEYEISDIKSDIRYFNGRDYD